ncbi:MAG: shikimate kinase AroK [Thiotrichales bacterium]
MHRLFLIGPMGAGKTTLGRMIAEDLGYAFIDSDRVIEARTGVDIPTIFDFEGESGFREREARTIEDLTLMDNIVLATGGGAVLRAENRRLLRERGFVVYLRVSIASQLVRTARDRNRPLLQTVNPEAKLRALAEARTPLYESIAHLTVDTDHSRTRTLKNRIVLAYLQTQPAIE